MALEVVEPEGIVELDSQVELVLFLVLNLEAVHLIVVVVVAPCWA